MTTQNSIRYHRITGIIAAVLAVFVAAIAFSGQAKADSAPQHVKSWSATFPGDSVVDSKGNVYLVNIPTDSVVKYTDDGVLVKKWGGSGTEAGKFDRPEGIGIDSQDRIYVADSSNDRIQKFTAEGGLIKVIGSAGNSNGKFSYPTDVAIGSAGAIYVTDSGNDRIQKFNSSGTFVSKWGTTGSGNGQFNNGIFGIATDPAGNVFVSDITADRIQKFSATGTFIGKWGNKGTDAGEFNNPEGLAVDSKGNVFVADPNNNRVQKFTNNGEFVYEFGKSGVGPADLNHPTGISLDGQGHVYVSDSFNHRMQVFAFELPLANPTPEEEPDLPLAIPDPKKPEADPIPAPGEGVFDGKNLHIRLKCPARFNPACFTAAMPMTRAHGGKPMAVKSAKRKLAPNNWTVVSFVIKAKYRAKVQKMVDRDVKMLHVTQTIKSKKVRSKKASGPSKVFHIYRVRSAGN